jgi:methyl-accepting chemotaxis protein
MRWSSLSIRGKILLVNVGMALLSAAVLGLIFAKLHANARNMHDLLTRISSQEEVVTGQREQIGAQFSLLEQQLQLQGERDRGMARLGLARDAAAHFLQLSYWLTDLALSMQTSSEREAKRHGAALGAIIGQLAATDREAAAGLKPLVDGFVAVMTQAVDSYDDDNRVKGNALAAQARIQANLALERLGALCVQLEAAIDAIDARLKTLNERIHQAGAQVLDAGKQLDIARGEVGGATTRVISANVDLRSWVLICMAVGFAFGVVASWLLAGSLTRRTRRSLDVLEAVAAGDLTKRQEIDSQDEIGRMAQALNATLDALRESLRTIATGSQALSGSSGQLQGISERMDTDVGATSSEAVNASSAAGQVAATMEGLAAGIQEMNHSIDEIARSSTSAATVSANAVSVVASAADSVAQLSEASAAIGEIAKMIGNLAAQSNLLALNATIEAARAGDAGKGFAVVAGEVKELARQTATATTGINQRIAAIQERSASTRGSITEIGTVIRQVNEYQQSIAGAVEEQAATTRELSGNIAQIAQVSGQIAASIDSLVAVAKRTRAGSADTRQAAQQLDQLATRLAAVVGKFSC